MPITVLAKPSDHIEAYFEGTEGLVAGVDEASYTGKIVFQEIGTLQRGLRPMIQQIIPPRP